MSGGRLPIGHSPAGGFTLVELMIATALGLLLTAGIVSVFAATGKAGSVQMRMARLQEEARYAVGRIGEDLAMAGAQYCSNGGGLATARTWAYQDDLRSPLSYVPAADLQLPDNSVTLATAPTAPFALPSSFFMRGYQCSTTACRPDVPAAVAPAMGSGAGSRMRGADVLTVRYLSGRGWAVRADDASPLTPFDIVPSAGDPPLDTFAVGDLALLADCTQAQIFPVMRAGTRFTPETRFPGFVPVGVDTRSDLRLFDFNRDFVTVTYYLKLVADADPDAPSGHRVAALMRKVNGNAAQEIARGVERLDFLYGIENDQGGTLYLTADQVDAGVDAAGVAVACPPQPPASATTAGCLWRAVKTIELHLLVNSSDELPTLTAGELAYRYSCDGSITCTSDAAVAPPAAPLTAPLDNGLGKRLLRREFTSVVSVRNYNP
ncbi:MAG: PilW family protein [Xanthomonadaceae bacterium]|nr:PilW family protein [Xanthomonadaceae bacterium]MDE1959807.1 PilW family protein [Xanthomonadaceae bacterium]MDE2177499.1 PilW family protein [Xanthomonadaceae bacterium]